MIHSTNVNMNSWFLNIKQSNLKDKENNKLCAIKRKQECKPNSMKRRGLFNSENIKPSVETEQNIVSSQKHWEDTMLNDKMCNILICHGLNKAPKI